ncbi:MAG: nuclear transport factor 2 family protein, partial [Actinomycetota bacterium]|nr:nuclear transport factor 2 family protein [Actinomycetota bacterium]
MCTKMTHMPARNVDIYKQVLADFGERGVDGALEHFADDVEAYDPDLPGGGGFRGHEAVRKLLEELLKGVEAVEVRGFDLLPAGDRVVGLIHTYARGDRDRMEVELRDAHTFTFRDGKVVYWRLYLDQKEALSDAGLDPTLAEGGRRSA